MIVVPLLSAGILRGAGHPAEARGNVDGLVVRDHVAVGAVAPVGPLVELGGARLLERRPLAVSLDERRPFGSQHPKQFRLLEGRSAHDEVRQIFRVRKRATGPGFDRRQAVESAFLEFAPGLPDLRFVGLEDVDDAAAAVGQFDGEHPVARSDQDADAAGSPFEDLVKGRRFLDEEEKTDPR